MYICVYIYIERERATSHLPVQQHFECRFRDAVDWDFDLRSTPDDSLATRFEHDDPQRGRPPGFTSRVAGEAAEIWRETEREGEREGDGGRECGGGGRREGGKQGRRVGIIKRDHNWWIGLNVTPVSSWTIAVEKPLKNNERMGAGCVTNGGKRALSCISAFSNGREAATFLWYDHDVRRRS